MKTITSFQLLARLKGIIPALESSHAIAAAMKEARKLTPEQVLLVCLSGRGDKDLAHAMATIAAMNKKTIS